MSKTDQPSAAVRGSEFTDLLGLAPAYLADGQMAYKATIVASWPAHSQARFRTLLYTGEQLEQAVADERERWEVLAQHEGNTDRRQWASTGTWLYPGDKLVVVRA